MQYVINLFLDNEAKVWVATSDDIPGLVLESDSFDALIERVQIAVPELIELNHLSSSFENTPGPVPTSQVPKVRIDYKGLLSYAKKEGVTPAELSQEEKMRFVTELRPGEITKLNKKLSGVLTDEDLVDNFYSEKDESVLSAIREGIPQETVMKIFKITAEKYAKYLNML